MLPLLLIGFGTLLLYVGGELLVRNVLRLASAFGTSPLVIGLTVVAFGTSAPEVAVVVGAAIADKPAIALGNVLGSNIANLGLILALAVLWRPLQARRGFLRRDLPFMVATSVLLLPLAGFGGLGRVVAILLLALLVWYLRILFGSDDSLPSEIAEAHPPSSSGRLRAVLGASVAIALLVWGADLLVDGAVDVARGFGISERVIGLTLVAFGTSVPELASCLAAVAKRQGDIVLGNVIGSNIFNTLLVLPVGLLVRPITASKTDLIDIGVMIFFAVLAFVFLFRRGRMRRFEGAILLLAYVGYVGFLFVRP